MQATIVSARIMATSRKRHGAAVVLAGLLPSAQKRPQEGNPGAKPFASNQVELEPVSY